MKERGEDNQSELARYVGVSPQAVQQWVKGDTAPRGKNLQKVAEYFGVPQSYIQFGEGAVTEQVKIKGLVPLISWVQAGNWTETIDNFSPGDAEEWLACTEKHSDQTYALTVVGESMFNPSGEWSFREGEIIFVDPEREPQHRNFVVVRMTNENTATFKRLIIDNEKKYLEALNPSWPNRIIPVNGDAVFCGVVISVSRRTF